MEQQKAERIIELNQQINSLSYRILILLKEIGELRSIKKKHQEEVRQLRRDDD